MKIMHLLPALSSGGVEQVVLELCEGIAACGEECVVVSAGGSMVGQILQKGARHITLPIGKKSPATIWHALRLARLLHVEKPDILHVHSRVPAWAGFLACHLLRLQERPCVVTTFHGFYSVNAYSAIMTKAQRVIAVSTCIRNHILTAYPNVLPERVLTIQNSIDLTEHYPDFRPSEKWLTQWHSEHPELEGKYLLCLPGRITRGKGTHHLAPILATLKARGIPAHALIPGEAKKGKEAFRNELVHSFEDLGLSSDVTWLGLRRDIREIIHVSNIVLALSIQPEAGPKGTLEALALGRPVVGYAHGGVGEELEQFFPEGLVPVGDTEAVADLLTKWYRNPPPPPRRVGAPYRREDMIQSYHELYLNLFHLKITSPPL